MNERETSIPWEELEVYDDEGRPYHGTLSDLLRDAPANFDDVVIEDGHIVEWSQRFIAAPGERPDWDTPRGAVDWNGFIAALSAVRHRLSGG